MNHVTVQGVLQASSVQDISSKISRNPTGSWPRASPSISREDNFQHTVRVPTLAPLLRPSTPHAPVFSSFECLSQK